jgi:transposase
MELISGATSLAEACRQYNLKPQALSRWKTEFLEKAPQLFQSREQSSQEQARIAELERMIGRLTLELEIAKKSLSHVPWQPGQKRALVMRLAAEYPVSLVCGILGYPRSS